MIFIWINLILVHKIKKLCTHLYSGTIEQVLMKLEENLTVVKRPSKKDFSKFYC